MALFRERLHFAIVGRFGFAVILVWAATLPTFERAYELARIVATRLRHPADLEWMEGGTLIQAQRVLDGLPLYPPVGRGFMPFSYPPMHTWVIAFFGRFVGVDYAMARTVSLVALAIASALLAAEVSRTFHALGARWAFALVGIGTIVSGYPATGGWFDVIRCDVLGAALVICGAYAAAGFARQRPPARRSGVDSATDWARALASGTFFAAAILTKQTCVFPVSMALLWLVVYRFRYGVIAGVVAVGGAGLITAILQSQSEGRYWFYVTTILQRHTLEAANVEKALRTVDTEPVYVWPTLALAVALLLFRRLSPRAALWAMVLAGNVLATVLPLAKTGGFVNNLIPLVLSAGCTALIVGGDVVAFVLKDARTRAPLATALAAVLSTHTLLLRFSATQFSIAPATATAAIALNSAIAKLGTSVVATNAPFLPMRNGARAEALHAMPWLDATWARVPGLDYESYLDRVRPEYVLTTDEQVESTTCGLDRSYVLVPQSLPVVLPNAGLQTALRHVFKRGAAPKRQRVLFDFESGTFDGFTVQGDAFGSRPKESILGTQSPLVCVQGRFAANSYDAMHDDAATGSMESTPFVIDMPRLTLRVAGGGTTRVALSIEGTVAHEARGQNTERLTLVTWDLASQVGRTAKLLVVDDDAGAWGHIVIDDVRLVDP